jgi:hypothetical protein
MDSVQNCDSYIDILSSQSYRAFSLFAAYNKIGLYAQYILVP